MGEPRNYAKFRRELMALCPWLGEQEIYRNWIGHLRSGFLVKDCTCAWQVRQEPTLGTDGKYHYVYITTNPKGEIYVGKHSCNFIHDGYHGSGDEIREAQARGDKLTTTPLEFFRTDSMALAAEGEIVDRMFLIEPGVLNKVPGGDDSHHDEVSTPVEAPAQKKLETEENEVNVNDALFFGEAIHFPTTRNCPKVVEQPKGSVKPCEGNAKNVPDASGKKKARDWWPFKRLEIAIGKELEYAPNPEIKVTVYNDQDAVMYNGEVRKLKELTETLAVGCRVTNCLNFWRCDGQIVTEIRNKLKALGR